MVNVMDTSKAAPTWLDSRLDDDAAWADGVPDDAAPWVAAAFDALAALSPDDVMLGAAELEALSPLDDAFTLVGEPVAGVVAGVDVGAWLTPDVDFLDADDVAFEVHESDLAVVDAPGAPALVDPFDTLSDGDRDGDAPAVDPVDVAGPTDVPGAPVPADDIVTAPITPTDGAHDDPRPAPDLAPDRAEMTTDMPAADSPPAESLDVAAPLDDSGLYDGRLDVHLDAHLGSGIDPIDDGDDSVDDAVAHDADTDEAWTVGEGEWLDD